MAASRAKVLLSILYRAICVRFSQSYRKSRYVRLHHYSCSIVSIALFYDSENRFDLGKRYYKNSTYLSHAYDEPEYLPGRKSLADAFYYNLLNRSPDVALQC